MKKTILIGAFAALLCGVGEVAQASSDDLLFPGQMCVKDEANAGGIDYYRGTIGNTSTSNELILTCPAVRDQNGRNITSVWVRTVDRHPVDDVDCFVAYWAPANIGDMLIASAPNSTTGASGDVQVINFGSLTTVVNAHYFLDCRLPPHMPGARSHIISYRVDEDTFG